MDSGDAPRARIFGDYELTAAPLALTRAGAPVELRLQALKLLELFAEKAGALVTHDDIRARVWGESHVDFSGGTHALIREIRIALGDDAAAPRFIETIPRQGYRFIADVSAGAGSPAAAAPPRRLWIAAGAVCAALAAAAVVVAAIPAPASPAREATLKGEYLLEKGDAASLEKSAAHFAAALKADPGYAAAHAGLAEIAVMKGDYDGAEREAKAALAADARLASAHLHLGMVAALRDWDWRGASEDVARALAIDARLAKAHGAKAMIETIRGRPDEALKAGARARALDPVSALIRADHGWFQYYAGAYADAAASCAAARELAPEMAGALYCELKAATAANDIKAACAAAARILNLWKAEDALAARLAENPTPTDLRAFEDWRRRTALTLDAAGDIPKESLADALAEAGDLEAAADALLAAAQAHSPLFPLIVRDPAFTPLHADSRYLEALELAGLDAAPDAAVRRAPKAF